jgi:Flp pilus assembly protein TadG
MSFGKAVIEWLWPSERRQATRLAALPLLAYFWDGGEPRSWRVRDVSPHGMYLLTEQRWYRNTMVTVTLTRTDLDESNPKRSIQVVARVVHAGTDGVGVNFVWPEKSQAEISAVSDKKRMKTFLHGLDRDANQLTLSSASSSSRRLRKQRANAFPRLAGERGQALIEFVLTLPLILLLLLNLVNFGGFFYAWITVSNAARAGANYAVLGFVSAGAPSTPTGAQIKTLVASDIVSLPNASSLVVNACTKFGASIQTLTGTCSAASFPSSDPEPTSFVITSVDATYTYIPFIQGFTFPRLNIYLTLPPTTVRQIALMRSYQ